MERNQSEWAQSETYLSAFETLIGDQRAGRTSQGLIEGIIGGESLRAAVFAPVAGCRVCSTEFAT